MSVKFICFRFITLIALAGCTAQTIDYFYRSPIFCNVSAGCDEVIFSGVGRAFGVPLPVMGLVSFGLFLCLTLLPHQSLTQLLGPLAIAAGVCGLTLVMIQVWWLKQICSLCLIIDACAMGLAALELSRSQKVL